METIWIGGDDDMAAEKTARLDTKHGFLKQIIKNQIARDEYDKEVKAQHKQQRRQRSQAWRRPDQNIYAPPTKKNAAVNGETVPDSGPPEREEMMNIEYVDQDNKVTHHMMYTGDDPRKVANMIGRKEGLPPDYAQALCEMIREELERLETGT